MSVCHLCHQGKRSQSEAVSEESGLGKEATHKGEVNDVNAHEYYDENGFIFFPYHRLFARHPGLDKFTDMRVA